LLNGKLIFPARFAGDGGPSAKAMRGSNPGEAAFYA
jgi:hypothetical protein